MFSPPCGDCTQMQVVMIPSRKFPPPYGDCTFSCILFFFCFLFSPPYGDCTAIYTEALEEAFSPPCGDCTLNISQNTAKLKSRMARKYSLYYNDVLLR